MTLYALLMDEINKEMIDSSLGITIPESETRVPCLLWMDEVLLAETNVPIKRNSLI